jgi:hypothetical protein
MPAKITAAMLYDLVECPHRYAVERTVHFLMTRER